MSGSVFNSEPTKTKTPENDSTKAGVMSYRELLQSRIETIRYQIGQAQAGMFRPLADTIAPKDIRPTSGSPLAARQLTPYEYQISSMLGWMQAHHEAGTVNGVPEPQSEFEKDFEAELTKLAVSRGDGVTIAVQLERRDFLEYEQIFKDEIAARSGPLAKYSQNVPVGPSAFVYASRSAETPIRSSLQPNGSDRSLDAARKRRKSPIVNFFLALLVLYLVYIVAYMGFLGHDLFRFARSF